MAPDPSRRTVLAAALAVLTGGCAASGNQGDSPTGTQTATTDSPPASATPTATATPTGEELLAQLPAPSPLASPLPALVRADDRQAFANEHDLTYRNGAVKVYIELVAGGTRPDRYLVEVTGTSDSVVIAFVDVDDLPRVALDADVRIVRPPPDVNPHETDTRS